MQDGNVIEVRNVYKKYKNYFDKGNTLKEKILNQNRNKYQENWVLNGISFNVKKGEAIGLIGKNGCGKSTTLKLLTKIIYPDKGQIEIVGRVSSLLELGAGFHPDLSGYENIYLNAAVFGLTRREIDRRLDEIIRFSELKDYINNPIRTYSSGMYMKLAFSVAINVDADILLIDEILGVGDVNFQKKCFEKLQEIKKRGTTIVIVSHSTNQIEKICDKSIWIEDGTIKKVGNPQEVHNSYLSEMEGRRIVQKEKEAIEKKLADEHKKKSENKLERERQKKLGEKLAKERQEIRETIAGENKEKRDQERKNIEDRKLSRKASEIEFNTNLQNQKEYQDTPSTQKISSEPFDLQQYHLDLSHIEKQEQDEIKYQAELILHAEEARKKQESIQNAFKLDEIPEEDVWIEYYKKESNRLEAVIEEIKIENERLTSVIRQKELIYERLEKDKLAESVQWNQIISDLKSESERLNGVTSEKDGEILRLNKTISDKNDEIDRLDETILDKEEEMDRLNSIILDKEDEIDRLNSVISDKDTEIDKLTSTLLSKELDQTETIME